MQEMTSDICESINEGSSVRLIDYRDGKKYWVTKLKDKQCWMTQNLDYNGGGTESEYFAEDDITNNVAKYYDPGMYVYAAPTTSNKCSQDTSVGLADCPSWVNVTDWVASDDPNYSEIVNSTNKIYDAHYLVGNYYNWLAATSGTGLASVTTGDATGSICPMGWKLPFSSGTGSYVTLFTAYGTRSGLKFGDQDIRLRPLYFTYSGFVSDNNLYYVGDRGLYWSSAAHDAKTAFILYFTGNSISTASSTNGNRESGDSVRCVAR